MPANHVALLRAVNVGGTGKLPMKELATIFQKAGCSGVRTYIQSGNVIFNFEDDLAVLQRKVSDSIEKKFGFRPEIIFRKLPRLEAVVKGNPFLKQGAAETELHVWFLNDAPGSDEIAKLEKYRVAPDEFAVRGREIYLRLPNGAGNSKLASVRLKTVATGRNWRTVNKLIEMLKE